MSNERLNGDPGAGLGSTEHLLVGSSAPYLLIAAADGTWTSRSLPADGALTIGRGVESDIRLAERAASRRHARLEVAGAGSLRLVDLDSANGTLVGGRLVRNAAAPVRPGELILIGRTVLAVHVPPASEGCAPPLLQPRLATIGVDALVAKAAPTLISVLLLGETGVGKGVVAERIHHLSTRARGPLVQLNCAGLSAALLESELFGHERGAFTGAAQAKSGLLEAAAGGTVFLDEVGEMPMEVQAKLLVAIEQRIARRVGATRTTSIDVRFIFATHRDLEAEIRRGRFRADFFHRINGLTIGIPPLRQRLDELDGLISQFASDAAVSLQRDRPPVFDEDARAGLHRHDWPGNIRELRSVVARAVLFTEGNAVTSSILVAAGLPGDVLSPPDGSAEDAERKRLIAALAACGGNQSRAARMLGVARNTLIRWIQKHNIKRPRTKDDPSKDDPSKDDPSKDDPSKDALSEEDPPEEDPSEDDRRSTGRPS
jgi:pSer/pThr/pTyr-binding forkhead associated (FHA) protein